jgi:hypothetical protein
LFVSPPLDRYLEKFGIFVVLLPPMPLNGLSKEDVGDTSEMLRR